MKASSFGFWQNDTSSDPAITGLIYLLILIIAGLFSILVVRKTLKPEDSLSKKALLSIGITIGVLIAVFMVVYPILLFVALT